MVYCRRLRVDRSTGVNEGDKGENEGVEIVHVGILICNCGRKVGVNGGDGEVIFYFSSDVSDVLAIETIFILGRTRKGNRVSRLASLRFV